MQARTYTRLLEEALQAEIAADEAYTDWLQQFAARVGSRNCVARAGFGRDRNRR